MKGSCPYWREPTETGSEPSRLDPNPAYPLGRPTRRPSDRDFVARNVRPRQFGLDTRRRPESAPPARRGTTRSEPRVPATARALTARTSAGPAPETGPVPE